MFEKPFFFANGNYELFGILHKPIDRHLKGGYVFCHPFAEEKLWAHRIYVNFARELTKAGYAVLRFDYAGHGDSDGDFRNANIELWNSDILCAIEKLKQLEPEIDKIGLLGLRLGATMACIAAKNNDLIDNLILWEPVVDGNKYMQEILRINLTTQLAVFGKIVNNRETLVENMKAGELVNIDGYDVNFQLYKQISELNLLTEKSVTDLKCLITQLGKPNQKARKDIDELRQMFSSSSFEMVTEEPFWREIKQFYNSAPNLFKTTLTWLKANA